MTNQEMIQESWDSSNATFDIEAMKRGDGFRGLPPMPLVESYSPDTIVRMPFEPPKVYSTYFHMKREKVTGRYSVIGTYKDETCTVWECL